MRKTSAIFLTLLAVGLLLAATPSMAADRSGDGVTSQTNILYGEVDGQRLVLDVYRPAADAPAAEPRSPRPAILFVHGGGWSGGKKEDYAIDATMFAAEGFVCFSIDYRLVANGRNRYPAALEDCQRAVRWIRAHAAEYGVDPGRIGAIGASAGGHLVGLLGTRDTLTESVAPGWTAETTVGERKGEGKKKENAKGEGMTKTKGKAMADEKDGGKTKATPLADPLARYSSRVTCVVDVFGPADFTRPFPVKGLFNVNVQQLIDDFLGAPALETPALAREASPIFHIDDKTVPFLIVHGTEDGLVPLEQSERLHAALKKKGIESELLVMPGENHSLVMARSEPVFKKELELFNRHLRAGK